MTMQDSFQISGPNGTHDCLVLELLGPIVADILDTHSGMGRLPGTLAKTIAKQALLGLCFLHEQGIAHAGILCQHSFDLC
jgi:serine/threonine-protein kinase SRPK3